MGKLIVANWKMYLDRKNSIEFLRKIKTYNLKLKNCDLIICPSFLVLPEIKFLFRDSKILIHFGAQDCFWEEKGAYTGEISPFDLKEAGCEYVILGHSERRAYFKETDEAIGKKARAAASAGLAPILCVGETKNQRRKGQAANLIKKQLKKGLAEVHFSGKTKPVVAYEPVWAIGTGESCPPEEAAKMHRLIKKEAGRLAGKRRIPVLYGGSVDDKNIGGYLKQKEIDGVLVGGAGAKIESFLSILNEVKI